MINDFRNKLLDLIEGRLDETTTARIKQEIENNPEANQLYNEYLELQDVEKTISTKKFELSPSFTVKVMEEIRAEQESASFFRRVIMKINKLRLTAVGTALAASVALIFTLQERNTTAHLSVSPAKPQTPSLNESIPNASAPSEISKSYRTEAQPSPEAVVEEFTAELSELKKQHSPDKERLASSDDVLAGSQEPFQSRSTSIFGKIKHRAMSNIQMEPSLPSSRKRKDSYAGIGRATQRDISSEQYLAPIPQSRERYSFEAESKLTAVSDDPVSTFSIDVDTGSYTNTRRFLNNGQLPPKDAVRIEEFLNYFKYQYPEQYEKPFATYTELAEAPLNPGHHLLKVGIKARDTRQEERPWNLVFLVDVSGSMSSEDKLGLVKSSLQILLGKMRSQDRISLVTYAGISQVVLDGVGGSDRNSVSQKIEQLGARGGTNGAAGINDAYRLAKKHFIKGGVNRVIIATDGDFNVGTTSVSELVKKVEAQRENQVTLTTLGFGTGNYNEELMEKLANRGNGAYFYIDSFNEARKVFENDLFGTMEVVAKDVKLQIEFNPQVVSHYRLVGYDNRRLARQDFNNDKVDAGEIGSGHTVTALYEIALKGSSFAKEQSFEYRYSDNRSKAEKTAALDSIKGVETGELGFLKIRYKKPAGSNSKLLSFPLSAKVKKRPSNDFKFAAAVSYLASQLKQSSYWRDVPTADIIKLAEESRGSDQEGYRAEFIRLAKSARFLMVNHRQ